jgi:hypothetical protein
LTGLQDKKDYEKNEKLKFHNHPVILSKFKAKPKAKIRRRLIWQGITKRNWTIFNLHSGVQMFLE